MSYTLQWISSTSEPANIYENAAPVKREVAGIERLTSQ